MRKLLFVVFSVLALSCILNVTPVRAQENDEDKFSFGKVVSVAADQIVVKEYDFNKDADIETTYFLTPETELGNVNAVSDLIVGDDIVLDYSEKEGKRTVTTLVKEEKGAEGMTAEGEAEAEAVVPAEEVPVDQAVAQPAVEAAPVAEEAPVAEAAPAEVQ